MIFGIGQIQQGMNESDDRYQTKRLNNLRLYNLFKETFPTASITDHQNFINNMAGGDRYLRGQLPSEDALLAYDKERTRLTKEREENRRYELLTRQMEIESRADKIIDREAATGIDPKDIQKRLFEQFGENNPLGKIFRKRFGTGLQGVTSRVQAARVTKANEVWGNLKGLNLDESNLKTILDNMGYKSSNPIYKQVLASNTAFQKEKTEAKILKYIPEIKQDATFKAAALKGDKVGMGAAIESLAKLYGITIPNTTKEQMINSGIAETVAQKPEIVKKALTEMQIPIKNAVNALQAGDPLDVVRQSLEAQIPSGLPEDVKADILDRAMRSAQASSDTMSIGLQKKRELEIPKQVDDEVEMIRKQASDKDVVLGIAGSYGPLIKVGDDGVYDDAKADDKNAAINVARKQLMDSARALLADGASDGDIRLAVESLRTKQPPTLWADIDASTIRDELKRLNKPYDLASQRVAATIRRTKALDAKAPSEISQFVTGADRAIEMAKSYVAELQKVSVDPQYPKAEFDRNKLTMQNKITRNMKVIMDLINDPSLIRNRKDNDVEVLKVKHAILQDQLDLLTPIRGSVEVQREVAQKTLLTSASGGDATGRPEAYQNSLRQRIKQIDDLVRLGGMNFRRAKRQNLQNQPGFEALGALLGRERMTGTEDREFRAIMLNISQNLQRQLEKSIRDQASAASISQLR